MPLLNSLAPMKTRQVKLSLQPIFSAQKVIASRYHRNSNDQINFTGTGRYNGDEVEGEICTGFRDQTGAVSGSYRLIQTG